MEETQIVVQGLTELIQILTENADQSQLVELVAENNSYFDTEIYDLLNVLSDIRDLMAMIYAVIIIVIGAKLALWVGNLITTA